MAFNLKTKVWQTGALDWWAMIDDDDVYLGSREFPLPPEEGPGIRGEPEPDALPELLPRLEDGLPQQDPDGDGRDGAHESGDDVQGDPPFALPAYSSINSRPAKARGFFFARSTW